MVKTTQSSLTDRKKAQRYEALSFFKEVNEHIELLKKNDPADFFSESFWDELDKELFFLEFSSDDDTLNGDRYISDETHDSASRALIYVSALGKRKIAENLITNYGADVNYWDKNKNTPLLIALKRKRFKMVEFLLQNGARVKGTRQGNEAKRIVCVQGLSLALPILKKYGLDFMKPYVRSFQKYPQPFFRRIKIYPIIIAALTNQKKIVELLVQEKMPSDLRKTIEKSLAKPKRNFSEEIHEILEKALVSQKNKTFFSLLRKKEKGYTK